MRIGMILDESFPPDPRVENEAMYLIQNGFDVYLYCFDYTGRARAYEKINNIHVYRHKVSKIIYKLSALAYTLPLYHLLLKRSIKAFIRDQEIQIIHIHDIRIARTVFYLKDQLQLPVFLDLHENRPEIMKFYSYVQSFPGRLVIFPAIWKKFEYRYIKQADRVITVTSEAMNYYRSETAEPEKKFCVVPNSVRKAFYTDFKVDEKIVDKYRNTFNLLYLGDTGFRRGIQTLLESVVLLKDSIPELKLIIVGKSRADQKYRNFVLRAGIEKYVDFEGWQDVSLFQSYIIASHLGVSPLHKNIHHDTTYANKLFMYMAFGKPVIVSDCEAQANIVEEYHCGLVSKERDAEDFSLQVDKLFHDKELYKRYSSNAEKAVRQKLNWEMKSKALVNLYSEYDK